MLESWLKGQKGNFRTNSSLSFRAYSFLDYIHVSEYSLLNALSHVEHANGCHPVGSFYVSSLKITKAILDCKVQLKLGKKLSQHQHTNGFSAV